MAIGTTTPAVILHAYSVADSNTTIRVQNPNSTGAAAAGVVGAMADTAAVSLVSHGSGRTLARYGIPLGGYNEILSLTGNGLIVGTNGANPIVFGTNNLERLRIDSSGNVGIGTTTPRNTLEVDGLIRDKTGVLARNLLDVTTWTISGGSIGNWGMNGAASENVRVWGLDPRGGRGMLWSSPNDAVSDGDGGWNYPNIPVDPTKAYRATVWIKQTGAQSGTHYFGASGGNTLNLNGTVNSNPYYCAIGMGSLTVDKWYLFVGYLQGNDDTSTTSYGGVYDGDTGVKVANCTDFRNNTASTQTHRAYHFYDTNTANTAYFWGPRFEEMDGNEPSINEMISVAPASGLYSAANVSAGAFGSNTGGGNYTFPASVGVGTTTLSASFAVVSDFNFGSEGWLGGQIQIAGAGNGADKLSLGYDTTGGVGIIQAGTAGVAFRSLSINPSGGNVGIGTTTPVEKLLVSGGLSVTGTNYLGTGNALVHSSASLGPFIVGNTDSSGNSTVNAAGVRVLLGNTGFRVDSSPATAVGAARTFTTRLIIDPTTGVVGIGTASPSAAAGMTINHASGGLQIARTNSWLDYNATGGNYLGGITYFRDVDGTPVNAVVDGIGTTNTYFAAAGGNVGIGTTTPTFALTVYKASASNYLDMRGTAGAYDIADRWTDGTNHVYAGNMRGTTGLTGAFSVHTGGAARLNVLSTGNVLIGTTTQSALLTVGTSTSGLVASFGNGSGKINVGTIDPVYTIGGEKFATYLPGMTGQKEETTGNIQCPITDSRCEYVIDFKDLKKASDLWLFGKASNLVRDKGNFEAMTVVLTPAFNGRTWYKKNVAARTITVYAEVDSRFQIPDSDPLEISYRLTSPRFDSAQWTNISHDNDEGFNLDKLLK